jgi:putative ABC transport system permease protein
MNITETIRLAFTAILSNRLRAFLTVLGIVIGVLSVILLIALVSGLKNYITNEISSFGSNLIFVIPGKVGGGRGPGGVQVNRIQFSDVNNLKHKLEGEADVSTVVQKVAAAKYGNKTSDNMSTSGVEAIYPKIITSLKIDQGRFFTQSETDSGKRVAVVGPTVVKNLFGDNGQGIGKRIIIGTLSYEIVGVTTTRGSTFGVDQDNSAFIPLAALRRQFGIDQPNGIYISVHKAEDITSVQKTITVELKKRLSEDDFSVQTQDQALSTISQITGVLTLALGGIAAISLLVGGIGVMNIMLVSVTERTREIGLRKALGAQGKDIRNQFLVEAITLSGIGGIIGIILGILLSMIANQFITTEVTWWSIALSFGFSMLVGIVFGVTPAIRASKLDPITALRYE